MYSYKIIFSLFCQRNADKKKIYKIAATIEYFEDEDVNLFKKEAALSTLALLFF